MSKRVNVTIPKEVDPIFNWTVKYDPEFKGNKASIVAHYFAKGMRAAYEESLKNADPLDADTFSALTEYSRETLKRVSR
jgi:hypothetical protein